MQLSSRRQASQAKQDLGSVSTLLGPEEDNGLAALERAAAQREQHGLLVPYAVALRAETTCSGLLACLLLARAVKGGKGVEGVGGVRKVKEGQEEQASRRQKAGGERESGIGRGWGKGHVRRER